MANEGSDKINFAPPGAIENFFSPGWRSVHKILTFILQSIRLAGLNMNFIKGPVRWGIIGCGDVCEVKSGPAFGKVPGSSLIAVMRRDAGKAKDYAQRHNVARFYSDAGSLIHDPDVNAIYIATPPGSHEGYALEAIRAGKPVYIEKPVALNSAECRNMIVASEELGVPATVAHYRRCLGIFERVKSLVDQKTLGLPKLVTIRLLHPFKSSPGGTASNWRINPSLSGGGLLYDLAPHQLDILYWIFGAPYKINGLSINQGGNYDAPDITSLTAVFQDNILFQGLWSFNAPEHAREDTCAIVCDHGVLEFPFFSSFSTAKLKILRKGVTEEEEFAFPQHIQQPMIGQVVKYFQGNGENPCSLTDALVSLMMIERAYER